MAGKKFVPPRSAMQLRAIGPLSGLPEKLRLALTPGPAYESMVQPGPHDWLSFHDEAGQTWSDFELGGFRRPDPQREKIYLRPLGHFPAGQIPPLQTLEQFASAFFSMAVHVEEPISLRGVDFTTRVHPATAKRQILAPDILHYLAGRRPPDAFCVLGITMEDLFPDPAWNFVFGLASSGVRVGVYSFARYDPDFFGEPREVRYEQLLLKRCCKVLAHETAHMFGLLHCIYFRCLLNGSNHLEESDRRPVHLCPVCLRKLQFAVGFDVIRRYEKLLAFYRQAGFAGEVSWVESRLSWIFERSRSEEVDRGLQVLS